MVNAIEYEIDRQIDVLEKGGIIENETRQGVCYESSYDYSFLQKDFIISLNLSFYVAIRGPKNVSSLQTVA